MSQSKVEVATRVGVCAAAHAMWGMRGVELYGGARISYVDLGDGIGVESSDSSPFICQTVGDEVGEKVEG